MRLDGTVFKEAWIPVVCAGLVAAVVVALDQTLSLELEAYDTSSNALGTWGGAGGTERS